MPLSLTKASFPNKRLFVAVGALLGVVLGLAVAFIADAMDNSVRDSLFFSEILGVPFLGSVTKLSSKDLAEASVKTPVDYPAQQPRSVYTESLRGPKSITSDELASHRRANCLHRFGIASRGQVHRLPFHFARLMALCGDKVILIDGRQAPQFPAFAGTTGWRGRAFWKCCAIGAGSRRP